MEELIARIGTFFILIGTFLFILFLASDMANKTDFDYFFLAFLAVAVGWMMQKKRARPPSAGRFSMFRKKKEEPRKESSEKQKKEEKK